MRSTANAQTAGHQLGDRTPSGALPGVKPSVDRLYGRTKGSTLRHRQRVLLDQALPRLQLRPGCSADPAACFGHPVRELWLEVGFGGGEHARAVAAAHPHAGLVACEVYANGICSLLSALLPEGHEATGPLPGNLLLWTDDGRILLCALPPGTLSRLFLMFPDPWPKVRHAKRRFVHPDTVRLAARALRPGGTWRIASDDLTYQHWTASVLASQPWFDAPAPATARPAGWPPTRYEAKALRAGRAPLYWELTRNSTLMP